MSLDDDGLLRRQKLFLQQVEFDLRRINREVIHERIPELNKESFVRFASFVAETRARYLRAALAVSQTPSGSSEAELLLQTLRHEREAFEESKSAFAALERAIEQGYVDLKM